MPKNFKSCYLNNTSLSQRSIEFTNVETNHTNNILSKKKHNNIRSKNIVTSTNTESNNQEDNKKQTKNIYPLNNEKTNEEIISQCKDDNTIGWDKNTFDHLERPSCKVINRKLEDDTNNEYNRRSCAHNENKFHSSKDIEKQKTNGQIYFTPKHNKKDIVRKNTNNNKGNITENITSRNKLTIHTMEKKFSYKKVTTSQI